MLAVCWSDVGATGSRKSKTEVITAQLQWTSCSDVLSLLAYFFEDRWSGDSVTLDVRREWSWWSRVLSSCCVTGMEPYRAENKEALHMVWLLGIVSPFLSASLVLACEIIHSYAVDKVETQQCVREREQRIQNPTLPLYQHLLMYFEVRNWKS